MNIVIFSDTFLPKIDGVGISVDHFCRILGGRGHNFVICCPHYGPNDFDRIGDNIHIVRFKNAPLPSYPEIKVVLPSRKRIKKAMTMFPADLVHIQTPGPLGQYGVLASRMYGVPLMGTYHTLISEQDTYVSLYRLMKVDAMLNFFSAGKKIKKRLEKFERNPTKTLKKKLIMNLCNSVYERGEVILSPSHLIKEELLKHKVKTPIEVVSNGMDLSRFTGTAREAPGGAPRLLHVGRISYEKNCEVVLQAFKTILEAKPGATLDIYGDGPALESLKIEARHLEIADSVIFQGFVDRATLPDIYPQYDLFLTASTMETQGLVVLEAISCGVPCVGVNSFALPELIQHERNGAIVEPFDHAAMAERALEILNDPQLYKRYSQAGLDISQEHDIELCADRLENVYRILAETGHYRPALETAGV